MKYLSCLFLLFCWLLAAPLLGQEAEKPTQPPPNLPEEFKIEKEIEPPSFTWQLLNVLTTLGLLIAMVMLASWFFKRMMRTRMQQVNLTSDIKILEQRALTARTIVSVIDIRGKELAIAESTNGVTLLCQLTPEEESRSES
jgi:flagellar biogenesis protein FliO